MKNIFKNFIITLLVILIMLCTFYCSKTDKRRYKGGELFEAIKNNDDAKISEIYEIVKNDFEKYPDNLYLYNDKIFIEDYYEDFESAIETASKMIQIYKDKGPQLYITRAEYYYKLGKEKEAESDLVKSYDLYIESYKKTKDLEFLIWICFISKILNYPEYNKYIDEYDIATKNSNSDFSFIVDIIKENSSEELKNDFIGKPSLMPLIK